MLLFRSLATGLMAGCVVLLVGIQPRVMVLPRPAPPPSVRPVVAANATLIDVAGTVSPTLVSSLVKLDAGEHVVAVGDVRVDNDLAAGAEIASRAHGHDSFVDLSVAGAGGTRRVLVLIH